MRFNTANQTSSEEVIDDADTVFKKDSSLTRLVSLVNSLNDPEIKDIVVSFKKNLNTFVTWMYDQRWSFKYIELFSGEHQKMRRFCPDGLFIKSGSSLLFNKC